MAKTTQLERAIASLDGQIKVLQLARAHLVEQQTTKKPKAKAAATPKPAAPAASTGA